MHSIDRIIYDPDNSTLNIMTNSGAEYTVDHAGHALALSKRLHVGSGLSSELLAWLEKYRVPTVPKRYASLLEKLRVLRDELRSSVLTNDKR